MAPDLVGLKSGGRDGGLFGRSCLVVGGNRVGVAEQFSGGRGVAAPPARWHQCAVSGFGVRGRGGRRHLWSGVLVGRKTSALSPDWPLLVECVDFEHGAGAVGLKWAPFPHRLGGVCAECLFSNHAGKPTSRRAWSGLAVFGRLPSGDVVPVCVFYDFGGAHRQLGTRANA